MAVSPGPIFAGAWGVFSRSYEADYGWSRGSVMAVMTWMIAGMVAASPVIGVIIDRYGPVKVLKISTTCLLTLVGLVFHTITNLYMLYAIGFLTGALTIGAQSISYTRLLSLHFDKNYGFAVGIVASGLGAGYMIMAPIVEILIEKGDRILAYRGLGIMISVVLFMLCFVSNGLSTLRRVDHMNSDAQVQGMSLYDSLNTATFWLISGVIGVFSFVLTGIIPHLVLIAHEFTGDKNVVSIMIWFGLTTVVSRIVFGYYLDKLPVRYLAMYFFGISVIGLDIGLISSNLIALMIATIFLAIGFGAESDLIPCLIRQYFGLKAFGQIYGWIFMAFLIGAGLGPWVIGVGYDYFGSYRQPVAGLIIVAVIGLILLWAMKPPPTQSDVSIA